MQKNTGFDTAIAELIRANQESVEAFLEKCFKI